MILNHILLFILLNPVSMETGEDFRVQYHNGSSWQTVATFVAGTDFPTRHYKQ